MVAEKLKLPISKNKDLAFSVNGFYNWKNATSKFEKHRASVSHHQSIDALDTRETTKDVGKLIHASLSKKRAESRRALMAIISSVRYLARQGLALRGQYKKTEEREDDVGEIDSNFIQLLKLRANDIPCLGPWMSKSQDKFTTPEIQNELLSLMAMTILRQIVDTIRGKWYTIMIDETTNLSNTEQMIFCLRCVDDLLVHKEVIGPHCLENTSSETIVPTVEDILLRLNLTFEECCGQCYDGASNMSGLKSGVATRIMSEQPKALYSHCYTAIPLIWLVRMVSRI